MQRMNVNDPATLTKENVAALLASKDDSEHRQLRVLNDGSVILSDYVGSQRLEGVLVRWETLSEGAGYCGPEAATDETWVAQVLYGLRRVVPENLRGYIMD